MTGIGYHSVHAPRVEVEPCQRWEGGGSLALVHDIMTGSLPVEFDSCDVLYADLPWRSGFNGYNTRAGVDDGRTYPAFMAAVSEVVRAQRRPVMLVTGRHALPLLPKPAQTLPVVMPVANRQPALALAYNCVFRPDWEDTAGLVARLATWYRRVGDFCCGYGQSARAFTAAGRHFVASDYNPECVGYIATHADTWRPARPPGV